MLAMPAITRAASLTEISCYFPVAVGGPITKIIDDYAADFQRENPSFQRSTIMLYWNKAAFKEAGLDPDRPPASWQDHAAFAQDLTKRSGGLVEQWGGQIPASGRGSTLAKAAGTETYFANPARVEALDYWIDLTNRYHAHPPGIVEGGTTPRDFLEQRWR